MSEDYLVLTTEEVDALRAERDEAVRAMDAAHESLRKSGIQDAELRSDLEALRVHVATAQNQRDYWQTETRRLRDQIPKVGLYEP